MSDDNTELFIGLVGAVGTDLGLVCEELQAELRHYDFTPTQLHLSDYLADIGWNITLPEERFDERVAGRMWAGTKLRQVWGRGDALALLAMGKIADTRAEAAKQPEGEAAEDEEEGDGHEAAELDPALDRRAFILNSLKTREEVETLRAVYGPRFVLIAAYSPEEDRRKALNKKIGDSWGEKDESKWTHTSSELMHRDEREDEPHGQNVRNTYYLADFFVDAREKTRLREDLERIVSIMFGHPFMTPTKDEYALFAAEGAARLSAEPGRQVGAAITREGSIIALGTNEVPSPRGGPYWGEDEDDSREWKHCETGGGPRLDTNSRRQREIAEAIVDQLGKKGILNPDKTDAEKVRDAILATELGDITEFGRAVHAEMAALLDAAARGVPVRDAVIYTTTFPCHNCARHIVGSGVKKLVYVAPYAKSKAFELHPDAIDHASAKEKKGKVRFEPFVGVAPRRYLSYFEAEYRERSDEHLSRKTDAGEVADFEKKKARPLFTDLEPAGIRPEEGPYRFREIRALVRLDQTLEGNADTIKEVTFDE